ncbi:CBS domain-containing protein [Alteromonas sp. 345S023]|uniref:CBS domain-containing protein n=1 Tax=Alteromonas profundi TaxID=2696062 RepID=A0A7X5LMY9_9ALTE|nr:DUF294 nucleotidyltransferase-like domain-containing protein [Alteromonas profundi]NDV92308.1 CBS domain-containing protein [Alteromonas profundi]
MAAIAQQVSDFLAASAPFDSLSEAVRARLLKGAELIYLSDDNANAINEGPMALYLIQSGQFSVIDSADAQRHVSEGDYFGYPAILENTVYPVSIHIENPGLIFRFTAEVFSELLTIPQVHRFFQGLRSNALHNQAAKDSHSMWLYKRLEDVVTREPIHVDMATTIQQAALKMSSERVSSLIITEKGKLVGIVTDRDLRTRVVAKGLSYTQAIHSIMTPSPTTVSHQHTVFDALSVMTEKNLHHLPVVDKQGVSPVGMVTATDMVREQRGNVLFIIGELAKAESLYALTRLAWQLPHYFSRHAKRVGDFDIAGKVLSQATDIMTRKLITFYQQAHGKAPMMFAWLVYGSQAREDQTMGSDQDNGLLLASEPNSSQAAYFAAMSEYVCQGLAKCGIRLCDGNIMASNPELRLSIDQAIEQARGWVNAPTKDAIMHFNIFLDVRCAAGDSSLFKRMQKARSPLLAQSLFLAALARHTNDLAIPLSLFQTFTYEKGRELKDTIDLKTRAVALVNNIARIYALAAGVHTPSTLARLASLPANVGLAKEDANNLRDIWLFLNRLRWRHQLLNKVTDNAVSISTLSSIEKHQLKASFKAIDRAKQAMVVKFSGGVG